MSYLSFLIANRRFLGFGFLLALSSSFGQTYYISVYGGEIREVFDLSHGGFGTVYSIGTLASGLLLMWLGTVIDRVDLRIYGPSLLLGLATACVLMAITPGVVVLAFTIFMLRMFGQGLLSHAATTSMARYFGSGERGRAVSIAALGFPVAQGIFPAMAVILMAGLGWRGAWWASAAILVAIVPIALWLLTSMPASTGVFNAIIVLVFGELFLVMIPDIYIRPNLAGKKGKVHPLIVLIGFLGGTLLWGLKGFVLGPLALGLAQAAIQSYFEGGGK